MQGSIIFTSTDVIVNIGVIVAGIMVYLTKSKLPDLLREIFRTISGVE